MRRDSWKCLISISLALFGLLSIQAGFGGGSSALTLGEIGSKATSSMEGLSKLINSVSLVAGMAFAVGAVFKFKQHKDNPQQIPVGTPIALIFIAAALLFLPSVFGSLGKTLFGDNAEANTLSGTNKWVEDNKGS